MSSNKSFVLALGSLLTLAACSGGAVSGATDDAPNADAGSAASPPTPPSPSPNDPIPTGSDAGSDADADAKVDPPIAKHCNISPAQPDVCIENAQGRAGDVVDVDLVLVGSPTCGDAWEAGGRIIFDLTKFHLENEAEQVACRTRRLSPDANGNDTVSWNAFGGGSLGGCDANVKLGKADTLKLKIAPGTPPGDYDLTWSNAGFIGNATVAPECSTIGHGIAGKLRVLR